MTAPQFPLFSGLTELLIDILTKITKKALLCAYFRFYFPKSINKKCSVLSFHTRPDITSFVFFTLLSENKRNTSHFCLKIKETQNNTQLLILISSKTNWKYIQCDQNKMQALRQSANASFGGQAFILQETRHMSKFKFSLWSPRQCKNTKQKKNKKKKKKTKA